MWVINNLQDQTQILVWARLFDLTLPLLDFALVEKICTGYTYFFINYLTPLSNNQPIFSIVVALLFPTMGSWAVPIYFMLMVALTIFFSVSLFKRFRYWYAYTFIFTFCSYFWLKVGVHLELLNIWLLAVFIGLLKKFMYVGKRNSFQIMLLIVVTLILGSLVSNYIGFTLFGTFALYITSHIIVQRKDRHFADKVIFNSITVFLVSVSVLAIFLLPYIRALYFDAGHNVIRVQTAYRPYEDFVTFSLRPWYFFISSPKNPVYGHFSQAITQKIESTGYFLADDYFPAEHSAAFFGYLLLITFVATLIYGYKKLNLETKQKVKTLLLTTIILISFTMPPYFTISGLKIYTPGHLIAVLFPMFRVTARFSPMILLLMLLIMAEIINVIYVYKPKFFRIFMPILLVVTLVETFVPFKITKYDKVPDPYVYMGTQQPMTIKYLVYPYSKSNESFFWLPDHKQCLMNVRGYNYENISAEELTLKLFEPGTLDQAKELGATHILFYEADKYSDQISSLNSLELVQQFSDSVLYKIN